MTWVFSWLLTWDGQRGSEVHEVRIRASPWRPWESARVKPSSSPHLWPLPSFLSFFLSTLPLPLPCSQKLSVHSHFLWPLSRSPDLMRTIWGKEGRGEGGGEAGWAPPL